MRITFVLPWGAMAAALGACSMSGSAPSSEQTAAAPAMEERFAKAMPAEPALPPAMAPPTGSLSAALSGQALGGSSGAIGDAEGTFGARAPGKPSPRLARKDRGRGDGEGDDKGGVAGPGATGAPKPKRMVHYNGNLRLKVTNPGEVLNHAAELCEEVGGFIESLTVDTVVLRVPVAQFRPLFAKLVGLGEVLARSISAQDVTDAFTAMELRVKILRASRDRLVALLAKATTARAKLELLAEIQRLTEEVDQLERAMTQFQSLAQFSRIALAVEVKNVQVESRAAEPIAAFRWIHHLSPFSQGVAGANHWLELDAPKGMVALDRRDCWMAESADGARIWASQNDAGPAATTDFWIAAIKTRLGPEYASAAVTQVGKFRVLRLVDDKGDSGYRYLVAVRADGEKLQVVETYFPDAAQEKRYGDAVRGVIERGES
ncbi:MAG: DUF4349 domain-containing protein [Deltaproteobacteria bacterium]|nr:DUF4349 domain-containing protein [Deltaproteobacteria bacterium]